MKAIIQIIKETKELRKKYQYISHLPESVDQYLFIHILPLYRQGLGRIKQKFELLSEDGASSEEEYLEAVERIEQKRLEEKQSFKEYQEYVRKQDRWADNLLKRIPRISDAWKWHRTDAEIDEVHKAMRWRDGREDRRKNPPETIYEPLENYPAVLELVEKFKLEDKRNTSPQADPGPSLRIRNK